MSDLSSVDYSQYPSWEKKISPSGGVYYKIPNTSYLYDPFLSGTKGRPVLWTDDLDSRKQAEQERKDAIDLQKKQASPMGQLLPVAGSVAGVVGANQLINHLSPPTALDIIGGNTKNPQIVMNDGSVVPVNGGAAAPTSTGQAFSQGAAQSTPAPAADISGATPIGPASSSGAVPMSDGSVTPSASVVTDVPGGAPTVDAPSFWTKAPENGSLGQIVSGAAAIKGGYDTFNALQNGGAGIRTGMTELGMGIGGFGGPVGSFIGGAMGNLAGYGLQGDGIKNKLALAANPLTWPLLIPGVPGALMHKTTKQYQQERTGQLIDMGFTEEQMAGRGTGYNPETGDQRREFIDEKGHLTEAGMKNPTSLWGTDGMYKAIGPDYLNKMSEQDRIKLTQYAIDNNFLKPDKGDWVMSSENQQILREKAPEIIGRDVNATEETAALPLAPVPQAQSTFVAPQTVDVSGSGVKGAFVTGATSGRTPGFDPDPNNPGHFIRRR